jgi:RNA polymerase sigma factor (TIGR02999 family)
MTPPGELTLLLQLANAGDRDAAGRLFVLVEDDLKAIARKRKRATAVADVSTTALVDDAFCRLVARGDAAGEPGDRGKFFGYVSNKIHDLLIDTARASGRVKRGGRHQHVELQPEQVTREEAEVADLDLLLDLKSALERFEQFAPEEALGFRLRYFLGCTFEEVARVLGVSTTEAKRGHERARLWLQGQLKAYHLKQDV